MLPSVAVVQAAYDELIEMTTTTRELRDPITQEMAVTMLSVLFGAFSKRKADAENAIKLAACSSMFSPTTDIIGEATKLWKPLPKHPAVLWIAIKELIATQTFLPAPKELREAMMRARDRLLLLKLDAKRWLEFAEKADRIVFEQDRAAWAAAYAHLGSRVPSAMLARSNYGSEKDDAERCVALEKLWDPKYEAEEAAEQAKLEAAELAQLAPPPEPIRPTPGSPIARSRSWWSWPSVRALSCARAICA